MNKFALLAALIFCAISCSGKGGNGNPPAPVDLSGLWDFYFTDVPGTPGEYGPVEVSIAQTGSALSFTVTGGETGSGTVSGNSVNGTVVISGLSVEMTGTAAASAMNGTWTLTGGGLSGQWHAEKK